MAEAFPTASREQGAALRRLLLDRGFTTAEVCRRAGIASIYDFRSLREGRTAGVELGVPLDLLIRLFMDVELVERGTIEALLSPTEWRLLDELGLLTDAGNGRAHASLLLYPTESIWIASDLNANPTDAGAAVLREDAVYPAITRNTGHFLATLPSTPCDRFLELCAGTGIAALLAARDVGQAWAVDITDRATRFARFNAVLNGIENCTAVQGDLYAPVAGARFDRIVAHPPYMPALEQKYIFRDGGEDGEQITRGIVAGLPEHLAPGGSLHCTCMLTDRQGARAEQRLRQLLGEEEAEFDLVLLAHQTFQPTEYYFQLALAGRATLDEVHRRHEIFRRLNVERLVYASIVIRRHRAARPARTARRQAGPGTGPREVEWLERWEAAAADPGLPDRLMEAPLSVAPACRMRLSYTPADGEWAVEDCVLVTSWPFAVEAKCPPWTASLLGRCDGRRTVREHLAWLKSEGLVPADAPAKELAVLVRSLAAGGLLEIPEFPLPGR
jgi:SAM-dependent methyltransferase